jgi:hypothetical protein
MHEDNISNVGNHIPVLSLVSFAWVGLTRSGEAIEFLSASHHLFITHKHLLVYLLSGRYRPSLERQRLQSLLPSV